VWSQERPLCSKRESAFPAVIERARRDSRKRIIYAKKLSRLLKKLGRECKLSRKKFYLLEEKLSRIPGHLRHLRLLQLQIVQEHPNLSPEQFLRAYNEGSVDDDHFLYPQSFKLSVTGERSSVRLDQRGRPNHPSALLASQPIDQGEFGRAFQGVLRVLKIRPRPFYNVRHTFISVALTIGCNQKWIAEQTGTSIAMIQDHYGRYIRDDGDALLRAYVEQPKLEAIEEKTGTFAETFSSETSNYWNIVVVPTGIEPVFPT
jgi:hypothetical protein